MAGCTYTAISSLLLVAVLLQSCAAQVREAAPAAPGATLGPPAHEEQCYKYTEMLPASVTTLCPNGVAYRVDSTGTVVTLGRQYAPAGAGQMQWTKGDACDSDPASRYNVAATVLCGDASQNGYMNRDGCTFQISVYSPDACAKPSPPKAKPSPVVPSPVVPSPALPSPAKKPSPALPRKIPASPAVKEPIPVPEPVTPKLTPVKPKSTTLVDPTASAPAGSDTPGASSVDGQAVGAPGVELAGAGAVRGRAAQPHDKDNNKDERKLTKDGAVLAGIIIGPALIFGTMLCWGMLFAWRWYHEREAEQQSALGDPYSTIDNPIAGTKDDPSAVATPPPAPRLPSSSHWV